MKPYPDCECEQYECVNLCANTMQRLQKDKETGCVQLEPGVVSDCVLISSAKIRKVVQNNK